MFSVKTDELKKQIKNVAGAAARKSTLPVLTMILLEPKPGELFLSATNLEVGVRAKVEAKQLDSKLEEVEQGWINLADSPAWCIDATLLNDWLSLIDAPEIIFSYVPLELALTLSAGKNTCHIKTLPGDEFPVFKEDSGDGEYTFVELSAKELIKAAAVLPVTSVAPSEETNDHMTGAYVEIGENIQLTSADGIQLSSCEVKIVYRIRDAETSSKNFILPMSVFFQLAKIARAERNETIRLTYSIKDDKRNPPYFGMGDVMFFTNVYEGKFPDYLSILEPTEQHPYSFEVDTKVFARALYITSLFAARKDEYRPVQASVDTEAFVLFGQSEIGDVTLDLKDLALKEPGASLDFGFSAHYIKRLLEALDESRVNLRLKTDHDPIRVDTDGIKYLVMPMALDAHNKEQKETQEAQSVE